MNVRTHPRVLLELVGDVDLHALDEGHALLQARVLSLVGCWCGGGEGGGRCLGV